MDAGQICECSAELVIRVLMSSRGQEPPVAALCLKNALTTNGSVSQNLQQNGPYVLRNSTRLGQVENHPDRGQVLRRFAEVVARPKTTLDFLFDSFFKNMFE
jgi:hypothetical protein